MHDRSATFMLRRYVFIHVLIDGNLVRILLHVFLGTQVMQNPQIPLIFNGISPLQCNELQIKLMLSIIKPPFEKF